MYVTLSRFDSVPSFSRSYVAPAEPLLTSSMFCSNRYHKGGICAQETPAGHDVHDALPVAALYVPTAHAEHGPPLGPVHPTLQMQLVDTMQPLHEAPEFAGHVVQVPPFGP